MLLGLALLYSGLRVEAVSYERGTPVNRFGRGVDAFNAQNWEEAIGHFDGVARADSPYQVCVCV